MIQLPKDFQEFLRLLNEKKVKYLIIGGFAVGYHGYPRATGDMDVFVQKSKENAKRLVQVFKEFGFDVPQLTERLFLDKGKIVQIGRVPMRIEVHNDIAGVSFTECYRKRTAAVVGDLKTNFINLADLRKNKKACGRPKDLADLDNLN